VRALLGVVRLSVLRGEHHQRREKTAERDGALKPEERRRIGRDVSALPEDEIERRPGDDRREDDVDGHRATDHGRDVLDRQLVTPDVALGARAYRRDRGGVIDDEIAVLRDALGDGAFAHAPRGARRVPHRATGHLRAIPAGIPPRRGKTPHVRGR
jgi:hypothetical protein